MPEPVFTATRPAISLPEAVEVIKNATGFLAAMICASPSATAAGPFFSQSPLTVITLSTGKLLN